jgi:hypothetical protein
MSDLYFDSDDDPLEIDCNSWDDIQPLPLLPQQPEELLDFQGQLDHSLSLSGMGSPTLGPIDASIFNETYFVDAISLSPAQTMKNDCHQVRLERESDGRCADCGVQTHEVKHDPSGKKYLITKVPLTVPGEVHRGRCLFCHPLPASFIPKNSSGGIDIKGDMPPPQSAEVMQQQLEPQTTDQRRRLTISHDDGQSYSMALNRPPASQTMMPQELPLLSLKDMSPSSGSGDRTTAHRRRATVSDGQPYPMALNRPSASQKRSSMSQDLPLSFLQEMSPSSGGGDRTTASFSDRLNSLHAYRNLRASISSSNSDTASLSVASSQNLASNLASPGIWSYKSAPVWTGGQHLPFIKKDKKCDDFAETFQQQQLLIEQMQSQLNRFTEAAGASEKSRVGYCGSVKSHQSHKTHPTYQSQRSSHIYPQLSPTLHPPYVNDVGSDIAVISQHSSTPHT